MAKNPVFGLGTIVRLLGALAARVAKFVAQGKHLKLTVQERAALLALSAALDAIILLFPLPGDDNDPSTVDSTEE